MLKLPARMVNSTFKSKWQTGMTLIELMVAMVVSLIASTAMVLLMANTLGTGTQTIKMSRLTQEMRTAMQIMSRDLRRANYHWNAADCYANVNCNPDNTKVMAVSPVGGDCFRFWYDQEGDSDLDQVAFQLYTNNSVGRIQMKTLDLEDDDCDDNWGGWQTITDEDVVNVTAFTVTDESYCEEVSSSDSQFVSKLRLTMTAELQNQPQGIPVVKTIEDMIYVRNPVLNPGSSCP
jgi:type IV pilus assembly protein PilW